MDLAIVGGGAAAVCLLDRLAQTRATGNRVTVFEPSRQLWRGRPYQRDSTVVRVNAPPEEMSVRWGDPGHFGRWLAERLRGHDISCPPDPWFGDHFVPRPVYGQYLDEAAREAIALLKSKGWCVDIVRDTVTAAHRVGGSLLLRTRFSGDRTVDRAVLCVGGDRPADIYRLNGTPGFIADPYPTEHTLAGIDADRAVAIVGSGLTAVDTVIALAARGHRAPISIVSRNGALPAVRQRHVPYRLKHFTPERVRQLAEHGRRLDLDDLIDLMIGEFAAAELDPSTTFAEIRTIGEEDPVARLRRHFEAVNSDDWGLRILQRAVPDAGQDVWSLLSDDDRQYIMDSHFRSIMTLCCPIPPDSAATLLRLLDEGQLDVVSGMRDVSPVPGHGFEITTHDRTIRSHVVINAINAAADRIPNRSSSLVESLLKSGLVERNPYGGLSIERATSRVTVQGKPDPRLFALGDITFGSLFFTFGIPVLVERGHDIVNMLLRNEPRTRRRRGRTKRTVCTVR